MTIQSLEHRWLFFHSKTQSCGGLFSHEVYLMKNSMYIFPQNISFSGLISTYTNYNNDESLVI